jgi:hypothetical protein
MPERIEEEAAKKMVNIKHAGCENHNEAFRQAHYVH